MAIPISCPSCHRQYLLADDLAGKKVRCKLCNTVFKTPDKNVATPAESAVSPTNDGPTWREGVQTKARTVVPLPVGGLECRPDSNPRHHAVTSKGKGLLVAALLVCGGLGVLFLFGCGGIAVYFFLSQAPRGAPPRVEADLAKDNQKAPDIAKAKEIAKLWDIKKETAKSKETPKFKGQEKEGKEPQAKGKEPELPPMPKNFEKARNNTPTGKVDTLEYDSKMAGNKRKLVVYTTPGYSKDKKYPVFYVLHGAGGNETNWIRVGSASTILDNLYADKKIEAMVVVMPNAAVEGAADSKRGEGGSAIESEMINDIMPFIEGRYSIQQDASHRALAGLSLGGGQAIQVALKHLDKFAWIGGFSPALQGAATPKVEDTKNLKLLYLSWGDADPLFDSNKTFHTSMEIAKITHVWTVVPGGGHTYAVWRNDLYQFSQMIFKEPDKK